MVCSEVSGPRGVACHNAPHMCYLIDGKWRAALEVLCSATVMTEEAAVRFRTWLVQHEAGKGATRTCVTSLFKMYHAGRLQRIFLHSLLSRPAPCDDNAVVVAGGFPGMLYQRSLGGYSYRTQDIDVFVCSLSSAMEVAIKYGALVLKPLGLSMRINFRGGSFDEDTLFPDHCGDSAKGLFEACSIHELLRSGTDDATADGASSRPRWARAASKGEILQQVAVHTHDILRIAAASQAEFRDELRRCRYNLHEQLEPCPYKVIRTWMLSSLPGHTLLLPINIIEVELRRPLQNHDFAVQVCSGFDLVHCAVSLSMRDETHFDFREHRPDALRLLRSKRLRLTPASFGGDVKAQVMRVWKYIKRGFKW